MNDDFMPGVQVAPGIWRIADKPPAATVSLWRRILSGLLGVPQ